MFGLGKAFRFLILAAALAACSENQLTAPGINQETAQKPRYQPVAYLGPAIKIPADRVQVVEHFRDFSNIQPTDFITSPERVARLWAQQRLRATGGPGEVRFVIEKVGARSDIVGGVERVTAVLEAHVVINRGNGGESGRVAVLVDSETTIDGPVAPEDRQAIYHQISRDMATKLDEKLTEAVRTRLGDFLEPSEARVAVARPTPPVPARVPFVTSSATPVAPVQSARIPAPTKAPPIAEPASRPPAAEVASVAPAPVNIQPRPAWTDTAASRPGADSPLAGPDGRLPSEAWRRGWKWQAVE